MSERPGEFDHLALSQSAGGNSSAGGGSSAPAGGDFLEVSDSAGSSGAIPPSSEVAPPGPAVEEQYPHIEGYRIIGRLGAGGMGVVYRAIQLGTKREVALKLMAAHVADQDKDKKRFEREVQLSARLEHPNIARVYDSGLHRGAYYYAMELVDGRDLETHVNEEGLSQQDTLRLVATICRAVEYAHAHGVIHKDLKPANILVTRDGQPHIMDFGLARAFHETDHGLTVSLTGEATGTPAYMSPEQAAGKASEIDHRTDTYSLGVILYRLLLKQYPRDMTGPLYQVLQRIAEEDVLTPRQINVRLDGPLEALLLKALARDPGGRYSTAAEFAEAIERYVGTIRISEAIPTPRRGGRRGAFALAGIFLCLVGLAAAVRYDLLPVPEPAQPWLSWLMRAKPGELDRIRQQADQAWKDVEALNRGQGFGELLDSAATQRRVAKVLLGQNKLADAKEAYDQLASECSQIQQRQEQRQTAGKARGDAEAQAKTARDANAAELAKSQWDAAQSLVRQGEAEYGAGKFEVAAGLWKSARGMLGEAKTVAGIASLKRKVEQALTAAKALDRGQGFGTKLDAIETGLQAASSLAEGKQYPKAEEGYKALLVKCDELQALQKLRQQARDANTAAQTLREAVPADEKTVAKVAWDKANSLLTQAAAAFEDGRFEDAGRLWKESEPLFATVTASKDVAASRQKAEKAWLAVKDLDRGQGFRQRLDQVATLKQSAEAALQKGALAEANKIYVDANAACGKIEALQRERTAADKDRTDANEAAQQARAAGTEADAKALWAAAQNLATTAAAAFNEGKFDEAREGWRKSTGQYARAWEQTKGVRQLAAARQAYEAELGKHDKVKLAQYGGTDWQAVVAAAAKAAAAGGDFATAVVAYDQARGLIAPAARAAKEEEERQAFAKLTAEAKRVLAALPSDAGKTTAEHRQQVQTGLRAIQAALVYRPADTEALALEAKLEAYLGPAKELALDLGGGVSLKCVLIPAGKFLMGSPEGEKGRSSNEGPQREVTISRPFYMGVYETTQEQYEAVTGKNLSRFKGKTNPVKTVSWDDTVEFCKKLSTKTGKTVRLPTEAEWEYACRAGSKTRFGFGDEDGNLGDYAWYTSNNGSKTHSVGEKKPNAWGLYDMHGNVWEWCSDWYKDSYANAKNQDPQGPDSGSGRVLRGGCWGGGVSSCRSAWRGGGAADLRFTYLGFRVVVSAGMDSLGAMPSSALAPPKIPRPTERAPIYTAWPFDASEAARRQTETAKTLSAPRDLSLDLGDGVSMKLVLKLVLIPAGKFTMGSAETEKNRKDDEGPQREVTITKPFYMGITEVTQVNWTAVMRTAPWKDKQYAKHSADNAASYITWNDATEFCANLSQKTGRKVRLPTEAEWEYACRAGSTTEFCYGDGDDFGKLGEYAWYDKNVWKAWGIDNKYAHSVGSKKPNSWGLYDMHGNVMEWCADWYAYDYSTAKNEDPQGPDTGTFRTMRGGSFVGTARDCRSAHRNNYAAGSEWYNGGLRVVVSLGVDSSTATPMIVSDVADIRIALPRLETESQVRTQVLAWLEQHPAPVLLASLVAMWATETTATTANEPRYRMVVEKLTGKAWDKALLDAMNDKGFPGNPAQVMEVLTARTDKVKLWEQMRPLTAKTVLVQAMQSYWQKLSYLPTSTGEVEACMAYQGVKEEELDEAVRLAKAWGGYKYEFKSYDLPVLLALAPDKTLRATSRVQLVTGLAQTLMRRRHTPRNVDVRVGPYDFSDQFSKHVESLSMADLWRLTLLNEMLDRPLVQMNLREMADRDRNDTRGAWGGLVFFKEGKAEAMLYPMADSTPRNDLAYNPSPQARQFRPRSLCVFHGHFEKIANADRAGPTADELLAARKFGYTGLVITCVGDGLFCAHYYTPDLITISIGKFPFK